MRAWWEHALPACSPPCQPRSSLSAPANVACFLNWHWGFSVASIKLYRSCWQIAAAHVCEVELLPCYNSRLTVMLVWVSWLRGIYHRISLLRALQAWLVISLLCLNHYPSFPPAIPASLHLFIRLLLQPSCRLSRTPIFHLPDPKSSPLTSPELSSHSLSISLSPALYLSG